jgi:hypothetical protein
MALNFPNTGLYEGLQYTGDNGVTYIYDGEKWVGHAPAGAAGTNSITNGDYTVQVDGDGNLVIPVGAVIKDADGNPVTGTSWDLTSQGNGCPINVTLTTTTFDVQVPRNHLFFRDDGSWDIGSYFNENYITGDTYGGNGITLVTARGTVLFGNTPEQCVPTQSSHFHIMRDDPTTVDLFFGDDFNYVKLPYDSTLTNVGVQIGTDATNLWSFGKDGVLTLPSGNTRIGSLDGGGSDSILASTGTIFGIIAQGAMGTAGIQWIEDISSIGSTSTRTAGIAVNPFGGTTGTVQIVTGVTTGTRVSNTWEFGTDGTLTFPGSDPQSNYGGPGVIDYTTSSSLRIGGSDYTGVGFRQYNIRHAIAIGNGAQDSASTAGNYSIAIGSGDDTGYRAKDYSICIGTGAGYNDGAPVGFHSIAIGHKANYLTGHDNSITLNATGDELNINASGFYVKPVREDVGNTVKAVYYDTTTGELTYADPTGGNTIDPNIWIQTFVTDDVTDIVQIAISVEYDADNNIIALFDHVETGNNDSRYYSVGKFSPTGSRVWTARFSAGFYTDGWGLAVEQSSGAVYVTGSRNTDAPGEYTTSVLVKLNGTNGQVSWAQTYDFGYQSAIAVVDVASDGNPVMVGWVNDGTAYISTTKVDKDDGAIIWTRKINGQADEEAYGMAVGPNGEVVVVGYMSQLGPTNAAATLYSDPVSNANWTMGVGGNLSGVNFSVDITDGVPTFSNISDTVGNRSVDDVLGGLAGGVLGGAYPADNMTVKVGSVATDTDNRIVVVKYASDGTIAWQKAIQFDEGWDCNGADADIDSNGNIYICGSYNIPNQFSSSGIGILKLNSAGVKQWSRRVVGPCTAQSSSIVVGPDNKLYISAITIDPSPSFKWVVAKYGFDGLVEWQKFVDNTTTLEIAGTSFNGNGGGSNIAVTNDYVALGGGFGDFANGPTNTNIHAVVAQVPASGTAFVAGAWDFTDSGLSGTLNSSASDVTVVDAQLTDSDNTALENSSQSLNTDTSNFLIGTVYHAPGITTAELIGDGFQASTGSKVKIYTNTFGFQGGEETSIWVSDPGSNLLTTYTTGSSITFRNGEVRTITSSENSGSITYFYWDEPVVGSNNVNSGPNPRYPVTLKTANYSDEVRPTACIKPDLAEASNHLQYMKVYAGGGIPLPATSSLLDSLHIHMAGGENNVELFLGTDDNYVSAKEAGNTPAGVKLHSEVDVSVVDTNLRLDRKGSTWVSVYGDGRNRDLHNQTSDLSWSTIAVDEHGDYYVGGESNYYAETIVSKYSRDGGLLWSKYNNGATCSGYQFDGIAYHNGQVATLVKSDEGRDNNYYKLTVHDSATGSTLTTTDIYDPDGGLQAHSMIHHSTLGWTVVGQTYGEQYSTSAITITNSPYNYDVIRLPAASCLINGQYPASNNNWRIKGTNLPNGGQYLNEGVGIFNNVPITTVTGNGSGAYFVAKIDYNAGTYINYGVGSFGGGTGYAYGDQLKILGSLLGGVDGVNDMLFTANPQGDVMWGAENITGTPSLTYITIDMNYNMGYSEVDFRNGTFTLTREKQQRPWIWTGQWTRYLEPAVDAGNQNLDGRAYCVAEDPLTQALVVGGRIDNPLHGTSFVWKLAADGSTTWAKTIDNDTDTVYGIAVSTLDSAIYVGTDWSSINKLSSDGYLLYRAVSAGMWGLSNPEVKLAVEDDGIEYLYVGGYGGAAWTENTAFMLSKLTTDFKTVWGRAMDYHEDQLYVDYDDVRTKFALGKGQATYVGYGNHYGQNRDNAIIYTISTADHFETIDISGWKTYQDANQTWEIETGFGIFDLINAGVVASTSTALTAIADVSLDWTNFAFESRLVNLNATKRGIVGVETIDFADGGTLDHNPADIPPSMFFDPDLNNWEYTLQLSDRGRFIINQTVPNDSPCQDLTIYIPRNDQVAFPVGTVITLINANSTTGSNYKIKVEPVGYWTNTDGHARVWSTEGNQNNSVWSFRGIQTATLMKISSNGWLLTANNLTNED